MFKKMLVATDLSDVSTQVICSLEGLKRIGTKEAVLVHCFNIRDVGTLADQLMKMTRPSFEKQEQALADMGYKTSGEMVLGLPHIEINRLADKYDCSLVVVGSHGRTMAGEIFLGGVASSVLHNATRPVLVLRLKVKDEEGKKVCEPTICDPLHHVLFPTDFSDNAEHAFAYVKKIAECGVEQITLLHVQDKGNIDRHLKAKLDEFNQIDTERLERLKVELEGLGAKKVNVELPYGSPKKEIMDRTRKGDISLVVMGTQGHGYVGELLLGSVSYAVARYSKASVLLIPTI